MLLYQKAHLLMIVGYFFCVYFRVRGELNASYPRHDHGDPSVTWSDVKWVQSITKLPIVLKGILTGEKKLSCKEKELCCKNFRTNCQHSAALVKRNCLRVLIPMTQI